MPNKETIHQETGKDTRRIDTRIMITEKPDRISLEEITAVLHEAHESTAGSGMHFWARTQTAEDTRKRLGDDGVFYVALDGEELAGCAAVIFHPPGKKWYNSNSEYAEIKMVAVRKTYKGLGISNLLYDALEARAFKRVGFISMNTADDNKLVVDRNLRHGWKLIDYCSWRNTDYYSVVMGKWKNCPYTDQQLKNKFKSRKRMVRLFKNQKGQYRVPFISQ